VTTHPHGVKQGRVDRARYRIRVVGALGEEWSSWTDGMTVSARVVEGRATTTDLVGSLPDQTALMGVLERLDSRGARLLSVQLLGDGEADPGCPAADINE